MENFTVDFINEQIKKYGTNEYNEPLFRVVFSDEQTERRLGTFTDYYNKIFVRTVREVRTVRKYPWIRQRWILERWANGSLSHHPDLETDKNGVFVCVYIFQDDNGNPLPPLLKVCEIVIDNLLHPRNRNEAISKDKEIDEKTEKEEVDKIENEIKVYSEEVARKDPKSKRDSLSVGYVKEKNE